MKILLINPSSTEALADIMASEARRVAAPDTEIEAVTARFGTLYVGNRPEAAIAAHAVLDALAEHGAGHDAAIVSAFGDPGLEAARELMDFPVVGVAEAAMLTARMLGRRYSIVTLTPRLRTWYIDCVAEHGLDDRLASVRSLDAAIPDITTVRQDLRDRILALCLRAVDEDEAEVIILGGGPMAGLAHALADRIPVPALDGISCAVKLCEALVALGPRQPSVGSFARPPAKPAKGLSPALSKLIDRDED